MGDLRQSLTARPATIQMMDREGLSIRKGGNPSCAIHGGLGSPQRARLIEDKSSELYILPYA